MAKEHDPRNDARTFVVNRVVESAALVKTHQGTPLSRYGRLAFARVVSRLVEGQQTSMHEHLGVLDGYAFHTEGLRNLEAINGGYLVVQNHTTHGPIDGLALSIFIDYRFKIATGGGIRFIHTLGNDDELKGPDFTKPLGRYVAHALHQRVSDIFNTILVNNGKPPLEIFRTLRKGIHVGLFPEGTSSKSLARGNPKAGKLIEMVTSQNYPIIVAPTWSDGKTIFLNIGRSLDPEEVLKHKGDGDGQETVDYVMRLLARQLPSYLRGVYA